MELLWSMGYIGITGLISFYTGALLPRRWFNADKRPFKPFNWENEGRVYDKLAIRRWKGKILDMSKFMNNILPKKLPLSASVRDVQTLVSETCVAEVIHWILCFISVGNYWIWKKSIGGIVIWLLCIVGNLPFILVQRYNRPHLQNLKNKMLKREKFRRSEG